MIKKIILLIVVVGAIAAGVGYYWANKGVESTTSRSADITITANELAGQYSDATHLGKVLVVKGKIATLETANGITNITLETDNPMTSISCEMEAGSPTPSVKEGDEVSMKGQCDGKLSDVVLTRCIVMK